MTFITRTEGIRRSVEFLNGEQAEKATQLVVLVHARSVVAALEAEQRERKWLREVFERFLELCPCDPNPSTTDGPQQECPVHGDGTTFVAEVRALRRLADTVRGGDRYAIAHAQLALDVLDGRS